MSSQTRLMPPMAPCSEEDIASFAALVIHLRSQPELARENEKLLNAEALAQLTEGSRAFQHQHLGRQARAMQWPLVRIPDEIFRDRSRAGPLFTALLAAYREKNSSSWRTFDLTSPKRYDDNIDILRRMEKELTAAGFLRRPAIYLDDTIPQERRAKLQEIVEEFKGTIVTDSTKASHVVAFDAEIDKDEDLAEEEKRDAEGQDPEKLYLRTVMITDPSSSGSGAGGDGDASQDPMAMVHWWYWPPSYDEWLPAKDVSQVVEAEATRMPGMPWVVSYKFIRDIEKHNEWGLEADYAIPDFQNKVALYKSSQAQQVTTKKGARASATSKQIAASGSIFGKRDRRSGIGMNPRSIVTGFYEVSGSRIKRTVHDGALRVPGHASTIQQASMEAILSSWHQQEKNGVLKALTQARTHQLPGVDTLVRPSLDMSSGSTMIVTELSASSSGSTVARNRSVALEKSATERIRGGGEGDDEARKDVEMQDATGAAASPGDGQGDASQSAHAPTVAGAPSNGEANGDAKPTDSDVQIKDTPTQPAASAASAAPAAPAAPTEPAQPDAASLDRKPPESVQKTEVVNGPLSSQSLAFPAAQLVTAATAPAAPSALADTAPTAPAPEAIGDAHPGADASKEVAIGNAEKIESVQAPSSSTNGSAAPPPSNAGQTPLGGAVSEPSANAQSTDTAKAPPTGTAAAPIPPTAASPTDAVAKVEPTPAPSAPPVPSAPSARPDATPKAEERKDGQSSKPPEEKRAEDSSPKPSEEQKDEQSSKPPEEKKAEESSPKPSAVSSSGADAAAKTDDYLPLAKVPPTIVALSDEQKQRAAAASSTPAAAADGVTSNEAETPMDTPSWYEPTKISDFEKRILPEWFNDSAPHRTASTYMQARERMIEVARADTNKYLTATAVRRCIVGDAGSLLRLHEFLTHWRLINRSAIGESVPSAPGSNSYETTTATSQKRPVDESFWTDSRKSFLAKLVVETAHKKRKVDPDAMTNSPENGSKKKDQVSIDWSAIAADIGGGVSDTECQRTFLSLPLESSGDTKPPSDAGIGKRAQREEILRDLIKDVRPEVVEAATKAALEATGDLREAQKGALIGTIAAKAEARAVAEEETVNQLLNELLDQRMKKLENRVSLLDDVEGMFEAERVALELERRDLYTARCRHWFSGGN